MEFPKELFIVPPMYLPLPAVKGGAVETLIDLFIRENEKEHRVNITCFSTYDEDAKKQSESFKYTKFIYIHNNTKLNKFNYQISRIPHKLLGIRPYCFDFFHHEVFNYVRNHNKPDFIIAEGGSDVVEFKKISALVGKNRMILHVHVNCHSNNISDSASKIFSYIFAVSDFTLKTWDDNKKFLYASVLRNAVDISKYNIFSADDIETFRRNLAYSPKDFVLLFCGRLVEVKGIKELIEAVLSIDNSNIKLLIVGSSNFKGANVTPYQKEIQELTCGTDKVKFTGFIPNSEINKYYSLCQTVVISSIYDDPSPLVRLEAMASGKPLIVTQSGGITEGIPENGRLTVRKDPEYIVDDLKNAILELYDNPIKVKQMGEVNLEASKQFGEIDYYRNFLKQLDMAWNRNTDIYQRI